LFLNMLLAEMDLLYSLGKRVMLCIDNLQIAANEALKRAVQNSGANHHVLLSSDDVFAAFGGDDQLFYSCLGKASKVVLSKHASAHSCQKWSDVIGSYDKQEITSTHASNNNYFQKFGIGSTHTANINVKRENIIKPEEFHRMDEAEVYVLSRATGELAFAPIR